MPDNPQEQQTQAQQLQLLAQQQQTLHSMQPQQEQQQQQQLQPEDSGQPFCHGAVASEASMLQQQTLRQKMQQPAAKAAMRHDKDEAAATYVLWAADSDRHILPKLTRLLRSAPYTDPRQLRTPRSGSA